MDNINEVVERYCNLKTEVNSYKKQIDTDNEIIKSAMSGSNLTELNSENFTVKYSVTVTESFDEEKLIEKLNSMTYHTEEVSGPICVATGLNIVKMKPYVDMEALENAIYNGHINAAELADCKLVKETPKLTFKRRKEK